MSPVIQDNIKIAVLMSVYNQEKHLGEAIESILNQTYSNFEFIIINDGSTDNALSILEKYSGKDKRIKILNQKNIGLTKSLNNSLLNLTSTHVARMDADDVSHPNRLQNQIEEFKKNKKLSLLGTAARYIDKNGKKLFFSTQLKKFSYIKKYKHYTSPFIAPSVMFNLQDFKDLGFFDNTFKYSQDYDAWLRFIYNDKICSNLNIPLIDVRIHENNISNIYKKDQGRYSLFAKQLSKAGYKLEKDITDTSDLQSDSLFVLLPEKYHPTAIEILECEKIDPGFFYSIDKLKELCLEVEKLSYDKETTKVKARIYIKLAKKFYNKKELLFSIRLFFISFYTDFFETINFLVFKLLTKKYK